MTDLGPIEEAIEMIEKTGRTVKSVRLRRLRSSEYSVVIVVDPPFRNVELGTGFAGTPLAREKVSVWAQGYIYPYSSNIVHIVNDRIAKDRWAKEILGAGRQRELNGS